MASSFFVISDILIIGGRIPKELKDTVQESITEIISRQHLLRTVGEN